jgi:hypothetical protein
MPTAGLSFPRLRRHSSVHEPLSQHRQLRSSGLLTTELQPFCQISSVSGDAGHIFFYRSLH